MAQVKFYQDGAVWVYSDGYSEAEKTAISGDWRRFILGNYVNIIGSNNITRLFIDYNVLVTDIQKSSTPGDNYTDIIDFIGATESFFVSAASGSIITGSVFDYASLPLSSDHVSELWYVENYSGGFFSILGVYKYPKGIYSPNSSLIWELIPLNVKVSEDTTTIVNITNWAEFFNYNTDIGVGDIVLYNSIEYVNLTGLLTNTPPNIDSLNWNTKRIRVLSTYIFNNNLSTINELTPVYDTGVTGIAHNIDVARADSYLTSRVIGITDGETLPGNNGEVISFGFVQGNTSLIPIGPIYLGSNGGIVSNEPIQGNFIIELGNCLVSGINGLLFVNLQLSELAVEVTDTNGFPPEIFTDSVMTFDNITRTFTITPNIDKFRYYQDGLQYVKSIPQSVIISDVEGNHVIYFDGENLVELVNPSGGQIYTLIITKVIVSYIYWDATNQQQIYFAEERHGLSMSPRTHAYLHVTRGSQYIRPGLELTDIVIENGDNDIDGQFGVGGGQILDEDIVTTISTVASTVGLPVYYLSGPDSTAVVRRDYNPGYSLLQFNGTGRMLWNELTGGNWVLTESSNNDFVLCHVFAINDHISGNRLITFMGQNNYASTSLARVGAESEIFNLVSRGFLSQEFVAIASVIFQTSNGYTGLSKSRIVLDGEGNLYIDWRTVEGISGGGGSPSIDPKFSDQLFEIFDELDPTKRVNFITNNITTGTIRSFTFPDENGTLSLQVNDPSVESVNLIDDNTEIYGSLNQGLDGATVINGQAAINLLSSSIRMGSYSDSEGAILTFGPNGTIVPYQPINPPTEQSDSNAGPVNLTLADTWYDLGLLVTTLIEFINPTFTYELEFINNNLSRRADIELRLLVNGVPVPGTDLFYSVSANRTETIEGSIASINTYPVGSNLTFEIINDETLGSAINITGSISVANADTPVKTYRGIGSPEGIIVAETGSIYLNDSGGTGLTFWVKETGVGNTGWIAK